MNLVQRIEVWGDTHHPKWLDGLRIALGIVIFLKGVTFLADTDSVRRLIEESRLAIANGISLFSLVGVHYVAFAHLVGGLLIAVGLVTRIAIAFQLPVLIGAVFFVNITRGLTPLNSELWLSVLVLMLLILFFIIGSGRFSLDEWMKHHPDR